MDSPRASVTSTTAAADSEDRRVDDLPDDPAAAVALPQERDQESGKHPRTLLTMKMHGAHHRALASDDQRRRVRPGSLARPLC